MHPIVSTVAVSAGSANGIALSQSLAAGQSATLNGALVTNGIANLGAPRRVLITSAGNDSGITFTVTGTARNEQGNAAQSETVTGGNIAAVATTQDFLTVTSVVSSGPTAANITIGTNTTASGPWVPWDTYAVDFQVSVSGNAISGTPTWQVDYTYDDVFGTWLPSGVPFPRAKTLNTLNGVTGDLDGQFTLPIRASRLTVTNVGTQQLTQQQQGI